MLQRKPIWLDIVIHINNSSEVSTLCGKQWNLMSYSFLSKRERGISEEKISFNNNIASFGYSMLKPDREKAETAAYLWNEHGVLSQ